LPIRAKLVGAPAIPGSKRSMAARRNAHAPQAELLLRGHVIRRWAVV